MTKLADTEIPTLVDDADLCDARDCDRLAVYVSDDRLTYLCGFHGRR